MKIPALYVCPDTRLILKDKTAVYTYDFFSLERPNEYVYSYAYEEHELWGTYVESLSCTTPRSCDTTFTHEGYIILDIVPSEQGANDDSCIESLYEIILPKPEAHFLKEREQEYLKLADVQTEVAKTVSTVKNIRERIIKDGAKPLTLTLLTDTHYVANGNWETCAATVEAVNKEIPIDAVVHLGDLTDGMLSKRICREYSGKVLNRMRSWNKPLYVTIGNHDTNYFANNPELLSEEEQYREYIAPITEACKNSQPQTGKDVPQDNALCTQKDLWYKVRFIEQNLTCFFLASFDSKRHVRYGFPKEEILWLKEAFKQLAPEERIIIFSHEAPLSRLDYWAKEVYGQEELVPFLDAWQKEHDSPILAFIHGHTHADYIDRTHSFPIVSVGAGKIEYFEGKTPEGAVKPVREWHTVSQELWDTLIIDADAKTLDFVRFGAGIDRHIDCADWIKDATSEHVESGSKKELYHKPFIWAHRGASAYAPENTLLAFSKAIQMNADGVELDVQLTKDQELVVIHDERIDRVSNGAGFVADFTLVELRSFNFNKTCPQCEHAEIPTLQQVLTLLKPTNLTVNIELKTNINFYPGIEEKTVNLVKKMNMSHRVVYSSFNHHSVCKVLKLEPTAQVGFLYCDGTLDMVEYAKKHGTQALHPAQYLVKTPGFVEACKENKIKLHVWTANDRDTIGKLLQYGVDAIITNYPDVAYQMVHAKTAESHGEQSPANAGVTPQKRQAIPKRLLHALGVLYSKVRKVFVLIDKKVQKMAHGE